MWPVFFAIYLSEERYNDYIGGSEWTFVWAGTIFSVHSLTWLTTKWNVNLDAAFKSTTVKHVENAKLIKVIPATNAGSAEICTILRDTVCAALGFQCFFTIANVFVRMAARRTYPSCFRNGDSSTTLSKIVLRRCRMRLIKNQGRSSEHFKSPRV